MKKLFIISMYRFGLIVMALFTITFGIILVLELGFEISHAPSNFVFTVLIAIFIVPLILLSFSGVAFFNSKIDEYKRVKVS